jgi:hypothetical protein
VTINDPVFGRLEYRDGWRGQIDIPFLNKSFELTINNSLEFPPGEDEQRTWRTFLDRQSQLRQAVPRAITDWYMTNLKNLRTPYSSEEHAEFAPDVTDPEQIWALIKASRSVWLEIGHDDQSTAISIDFWTKWDEEHGLSLTFYQDQIGVSEGGAHWLDNTHYDLMGTRIQ